MSFNGPASFRGHPVEGDLDARQRLAEAGEIFERIRKAEAESVAVGLENPAERKEIIEATEDNVVDGYYTQTEVSVTYNYGSDEEWSRAESYVALDHMQILLDEVEGKLLSGEQVSDADVADVQALHEETKPGRSGLPLAESFPENDPRDMSPESDPAVSVEVPESFGSSFKEEKVKLHVDGPKFSLDNVEPVVLQEPGIAAFDAEKTSWGKVAYDAANLVADIEIAIGSQHSGAVETARYFMEQIDTALAKNPVSAQEVEVAFGHLKVIHAEREAYAEAEDDGLPNVFELQPDRAVARRKEVVKESIVLSRAKLTPEDLSDEGSIEINTDAVRSQQAPEVQELAEELQTLESAFSDASVPDEVLQSTVTEEVRPERPAPILDEVAQERRKAQQETQQRMQVDAAIERIEHAPGVGGFNFLNRFFGDGTSPIAELQAVSFDEFADMLEMKEPELQRHLMHQHPGKEVNYQALHRWQEHLKTLDSSAREFERKNGAAPTTRQVIDMAVLGNRL